MVRKPAAADAAQRYRFRHRDSSVIASRALKVLAVGLIGAMFLGPVASDAQVSSAQAVRFSIAINGRKVEPAHRTVRAKQGATLELAFTADEPVELHLHGYDRYLTLEPGKEAVMRLDAKIAGRFAIEAHRFGPSAGGARSRGHVVLLYLEVHPS
jgi:hypothetical protein